MNINEQGNKIAEKKISRKIKSASFRELRILQFRSHPDKANRNYCSVCGFRIRSAGHKSGSQHRIAAAISG